MQATVCRRALIAVAVLALSSQSACRRGDSFDEKIAAHRDTLVDQVNAPSEGVPFYTVETLNPIWNPSADAPIVRVPKLTLTAQDGRARDESLFAGKISIVGFFFATCQGFCPFLIEGMKSVEHELAELAGSSVQLVAISVDPQTDTPARLARYAQERKLDPAKGWTLLTGDESVIYGLAKKTFASQVIKRPSAPSSFAHSEHLYVLDGEGRLRGVLNGTRTDLRRDARSLVLQLLKEPGRAASDPGTADLAVTPGKAGRGRPSSR